MDMMHLYYKIIFLISINQIQGHATLRHMRDTELKLNKFVGSYTEKLDAIVSKVERGLDKLLSEKWSPLDKTDYVSTPLTVMVMLRRLVQDWPPLVATVGRVTKLNLLQLGEVQWPTINNFEEAAKSMMRSQKTYELSTALLVRGVQSDVFLTNVTATDCFEIGRQYFHKEQFLEAKEWLQYALTRAHESDEGTLRETVLYYLAAALWFSDGPRSSINIIRHILKEEPRSKPPKYLLDYYIIMTTKMCKSVKGELFRYLDQLHEDSGADLTVVYKYYRNKVAAKKHSALCRGEGKTDSQLRCRYVHYQKPHLRFQPFRLEELQLDPPVVRFYDLVSDKEVERLRGNAKELMRPAFVGTSNEKRVSEFRTSYVAWLYRNSTDWLDRRIAEATQMDTHTAEQCQVSRYGVSGEYLPHKDYLSLASWKQDRIATLMFYLNDVDQGGNTVFTTWNLSVPPVKNSAVLWFNYKPSGEGDPTSEHSGCPVLKGTKWVLNKWFHNGGNDVNFPCTLDKQGSFKGFYL